MKGQASVKVRIRWAADPQGNPFSACHSPVRREGHAIAKLAWQCHRGPAEENQTDHSGKKRYEVTVMGKTGGRGVNMGSEGPFFKGEGWGTAVVLAVYVERIKKSTVFHLFYLFIYELFWRKEEASQLLQTAIIPQSALFAIPVSPAGQRNCLPASLSNNKIKLITKFHKTSYIMVFA